MFGCCGILDDSYVQGRIILPTCAVRDEGTSYHYIPASEEIYADERSIKALRKCLENCNLAYTTGKVWTTDAIYRETPRAIEERKAQGCIAVEMEYSAALAVTQFRDIPLAPFLYGADTLTSERWEPRDLTDYGLSGAEKYMALAFECALCL